MPSYKAGIVIDSRKDNKNLDVAFGKNALRLSDSRLSKMKFAAAGLGVAGAASV